MAILSNRKVAILTEEGFEQIELTSPREALLAAGATVDIISPKSGKIKAWMRASLWRLFATARRC
jgi:protease I